MLEAFNYAAGSDYNDEIPQYDDNGDGISHTDPVPAEGDGRLGCRTYLTQLTAGNIDGDSDVDLLDFAGLGAYWLASGCGGCSGADLTCDKEVGLPDLQELSGNWLAEVE
jgi:hypothetical protein